MGLVGSTGRKRPRQSTSEDKGDGDREEKELEDDNVEEISPRRLTIRLACVALYVYSPVGKRYKRRQSIFMKRSLSKEPTRMS